MTDVDNEGRLHPAGGGSGGGENILTTATVGRPRPRVISGRPIRVHASPRLCYQIAFLGRLSTIKAGASGRPSYASGRGGAVSQFIRAPEGGKSGGPPCFRARAKTENPPIHLLSPPHPGRRTFGASPVCKFRYNAIESFGGAFANPFPFVSSEENILHYIFTILLLLLLLPCDSV